MSAPVHFRTLAEMAKAATPENYRRMSNDFAAWMEFNVAAKIVMPEWEPDGMLWTDDGVHECTGVTVVMTPKRKKKK